MIVIMFTAVIKLMKVRLFWIFIILILVACFFVKNLYTVKCVWNMYQRSRLCARNFSSVLETDVLTIFDIVRNTTLGNTGRTTINEDPMNHSLTKVTESSTIILKTY